jgi:hypothetical protein
MIGFTTIAAIVLAVVFVIIAGSVIAKSGDRPR